MAKTKDKFGNGMVYEQFGDVYKPEQEIGVWCPVCKTLWNSHNEQELERCRKIKKLENKLEAKTYPENCLFCKKKLEYKGTGRRKIFCNQNCKYKYHSHSVAKKIEQNCLPCPSCNSQNVGKDGHAKGHQKYLCKSCGRKFQDSYKYEGYSEIEITKENKTPACVYCGNRTWKHGKREGIQKYRCLRCLKVFSIHTRIKEKGYHSQTYKTYKTSSFYPNFKENREVLTEKDRADNYKKLRTSSNPLCYKCMQHTQKKSFSKKGYRIYVCPRCKIRFLKVTGENKNA